MIDCSVIIVNWNGKEYLADCIRSILEDSLGPTREIILIDNASTDGSADEAQEKFPEITVVRSDTNLGFTRANNLGIRKATGRYYCLVNTDVVVHPNCLANLVEYMDKHPDTGLAGPRVLNADGTIQRSSHPPRTYLFEFLLTFAAESILAGPAALGKNNLGRPDEDGGSSTPVLIGCFWIARREAVEQVGLLDEDLFFYGDDFDWCKRFWAAGWKVRQVADAEITHFGGGSSKHAPVRFYIEQQKSKLVYWRKHHGRLGWAYCATLIFAHQVLRLVPRAAMHVLRPSRREDNAHKIERGVACIRWMLGRGYAESAVTTRDEDDLEKVTR